MTRLDDIRRPVAILLGALALGVLLFVSGTPVADGQAGNSLLVQIAPEILPPDQSEHEVVYVQLRAADGTPVVATEDQSIRLFSSNPGIAEPAGDLTIREGASFGIGSLRLFDNEGLLTITATGKGLVSGSATLTVEAASEVNGNLWIELDPAPLWAVENSGSPAHLGITVVDEEGSPVVLSSDQPVLLSSSNPDVASSQNQIVIPAGRSSITVPIEIGSAGKADFIGIAPGYSSSPRALNVRPQIGFASELVVDIVPAQLSPGHGEQDPVAIVSAVDDDGQPTAIPCQEIFLTSSDPAVASIEWSAKRSCPSFATTLEIPLALEGEVGAISVVAASDGLRSGAGEFNAVATRKSRLRTTVVPADVLYEDQESPVLVIEARNELDRPFNTHNGFDVLLSSASDPIVETLHVQPGKSYGIWPLDALNSLENDKNEWWISAPGFESTNVIWDVSLLPLDIRTEVDSHPLLSGEQVTAMVYVTSNGSPISGATVDWQPTGLRPLSADEKTDFAGRAEALFIVEDAGDHRIVVTAQSPAHHDATGAATVNSIERSELSVAPARLFKLPPTYWLLLIAGLLLVSIGLARLKSHRLPRFLSSVGEGTPAEPVLETPAAEAAGFGVPDIESTAADYVLPIERFHQAQPEPNQSTVDSKPKDQHVSNELDPVADESKDDATESVQVQDIHREADLETARNISAIQASLTQLVNQSKTRQVPEIEAVKEPDQGNGSDSAEPREDSVEVSFDAGDAGAAPELAPAEIDSIPEPQAEDTVDVSRERILKLEVRLDNAIARFRALENETKTRIKNRDYKGALQTAEQVAQARRSIADISDMIGERSPIDETRVWMLFSEIQLRTGKFKQVLRSLDKAEQAAVKSKKLRIWSAAISAMRGIAEQNAA